jgi:hypothetical protein
MRERLTFLLIVSIDGSRDLVLVSAFPKLSDFPQKK